MKSRKDWNTAKWLRHLNGAWMNLIDVMLEVANHLEEDDKDE
tara:strand:- start:590 stop:715 length:126 start_codon:yes stop_codon:yes gene_type:complete